MSTRKTSDKIRDPIKKYCCNMEYIKLKTKLKTKKYINLTYYILY